MKIGITGAGGFIGSHLADALLARGDDVTGADLSDNPSSNLKDASRSPRFNYSRSDVKDYSSLQKSFASKLEVLYHLASNVGVDSYIDDPLGTIDTIMVGTRNVLEFCLKSGTRLIALSTSEVYGKNPQIPWSEKSDRVLGDPSIERWSYATSKGLSEHMINAFKKKYSLSATIVRPFNVYGPRQRSSFIIPAVIQKIIRGEPPVIYDDGRQTRCFTYVADLVAGLLACLDKDVGPGETFNLGNETEVSINDAVRLALEISDSSLKPLYLDTSKKFGERYEDIGRRIPDCSKAHRLLNWKAETLLRDGIKATYEWMKDSSN